MKTIICDLDGTLANIDHRLHFLEAKDWDGFFGAVYADTPQEWCLRLLAAMKTQGCEIVFVSGRNEVCRSDTKRWLWNFGMEDCPLYMRLAEDRQPDYVVKENIYNQYLKDRDILFILEDRKQVTDMWRKKGFVVLQCDEGEF